MFDLNSEAKILIALGFHLIQIQTKQIDRKSIPTCQISKLAIKKMSFLQFWAQEL